MFSFNPSLFKINGKEVNEDNYYSEVLKKIKELTTTSPEVTIKVQDPSKILDNTDDIILTKSSRERDFLKVGTIIKQYLNELLDEYNTETTKDTFLFTADDNVVLSGETTIPEEQSDSETQSINKNMEINDYPEVLPNIPSLSNKQYNEFINLCNESISFLKDYGEIGLKREWMLTKTDANNIAKVIFAPIRAWDYVGLECKMIKEEFDLIKSNLVQLSEDNACAKLGEQSWSGIFDRIKSLKTKWVKFNNYSSGDFVAKIKTTVLDKKTKQKLGTILVTLSITVQSGDIIPNETKGFLPVLTSNISYNIIAR